MKKLIPWIVLLLLAGALSACATGLQDLPTPTPLPAMVRVENTVFTVEKGPIISEREVLGEVVPETQAELYFKASGHIARLTAKAGDLVKQGEVIAELKVDDLLDQLSQARIDLALAQSNLEADTLERAYELQKAESEVVIWQARLGLAQNAFDRSGGGAGSEADLNLQIAAEQLKVAQSWLELVKSRPASGLAQAVERSQLSVARLERLVAENQVIAPFDCLILRTFFKAGSNVEAFAPVVVVGDPSNLVVRILYDFEISTILNPETPVFMAFQRSEAIDHPLAFLPDFLPVTNKKEGLDTSTDPPTLTYYYFRPVEDLPLGDTVGRQVYVRLVMGEKTDALLIDPVAIRGNDSVRYVIVLQGDQHRRVEVVRIGLKTTAKWEIIADLNEGDQVLGP